jgi:hypothetical protein
VPKMCASSSSGACGCRESHPPRSGYQSVFMGETEDRWRSVSQEWRSLRSIASAQAPGTQLLAAGKSAFKAGASLRS